MSSNDHIHTRLTHSLEVACVGRSLGMRVGEMLARRAAGLVRAQRSGGDRAVGLPGPRHRQSAVRPLRRGRHPPLVPAGRRRGWLDAMSDAERADFLSFEGNAQGFRVLTQLEYHQFDGGTRLTYATLGSYLKYPWTARHADAQGYKKHKFGCYQSELALLEQIARKLGLPQLAEERWARHPLVYLMEAADDICYALIDLEDGLEMDLLDYAEVEALLLDLVGDDLPRDLPPARPQGLAAAQAGDPARQGHRAPDQRRRARLRRPADAAARSAAWRAIWSSTCTARPSAACCAPRRWHARRSSRTSARPCTRSAPTPPWKSSSTPSAARRWSTTVDTRPVLQEPAHPRPAGTLRARTGLAAVPVVPAHDRLHRRHDRQLRHRNGPGDDRALQPGVKP